MIVATGVLHDRGLAPEKTWRAIHGAALTRAFQINAIGPALVAKHFLPLLGRRRKTAFAALSARVGSIGDNRLGGWYAYRASKAALNQLIRTLAIELARRPPEALCVGLHPGTVDTALSAPVQSGVPESKLFAPACAAAHLLAVLDELGPEDSGGLFAWGRQRCPVLISRPLLLPMTSQPLLPPMLSPPRDRAAAARIARQRPTSASPRSGRSGAPGRRL